ncbi:SDR family NAD(P)-dependent oxidoreductase [Paenibacillus sp. GXUN7292]|uniref:SDR family NAD(P)-dependent oxidoreductase n=1 Tax=Paenibacillus sp. GXUN7292 TaxID=3422499 RepID=UPI003D7D6BA7
MLLNGKKALITGAAGILGSAIAELFVKQGCEVVIADVDERKLKAVADTLGESYSGIEAVLLDVTDEDAVKRVMEGLDRLDILINNAGVTRGKKIEELTLQEWNTMLSLNLTSVYLCSQYALPLLKQSCAPVIVNMSSINAIRMVPGFPVYSAAKSAIIAFTQQLALEAAAYGIRANCISPGRTGSEEQIQARMNDPKYKLEVDCYPIGRTGRPNDIANAALFLSSELSAFITGINLVVDGGLSLLNPTALIRPDLRERWKKGEYRLEGIEA